MAQSKEAVLKVQSLLSAENIAARTRPMGEEGGEVFFEILVPEAEIQLAHTILISNGL